MVLADIASGEVDVADWLLFGGAVFFVLGAGEAVAQRAWRACLTNIGLGLVAVAWLVL